VAGPTPYLLLILAVALLAVSPLPCLLGRVVAAAGCYVACDCFSTGRGHVVPGWQLLTRKGPVAAPPAISHRWGPAAPLAFSQVHFHRSMSTVIARVKVALRAELDQGK
jgi:hypothetical protein